MTKFLKVCVILTVLFQAFVGTAKAQDIKGDVVDSKTQEPLIGAAVKVEGTQRAAVTDADGKFTISGLKAGQRYTLSVNYVSYQTQRLEGVAADGQLLHVSLNPDEQQIGEVTVTGVQRKNTTASVVQLARNSQLVVSGVSAQEIKLTQDANAGEVIRRVPGVSLIDDRFVMVRGLSQRYNNVWINGGAAPSSEADSRAFSFDMIPSGQLDNLTIVKSPSAEYPADYTGGFILVNTKDIPLENEFNVTAGYSFNNQSAFNDFLYSKGSSTDFLGFDHSLRPLKGGMDRTMNMIGDNMIDLSDNGLNNDWLIKSRRPWGDLKLGADWAHRWSVGGSKLGMIGSLSYSNNFKTYKDMANNFYDAYDEASDKVNPLRLSTDNQYNNDVRLGAMLNFTWLSASGATKLQLKNIFNQIGNSRYTWREGENAQAENFHSSEYYYRSRSTYTGQITGRHSLKDDTIDWSIGYAYSNRRLPDRKRYTVYEEDPMEHPGIYYWQGQDDPTREWTSLDEHILSASVNEERSFPLFRTTLKLKAGIYGEYRSRSYTTRYFFYKYQPQNQLPSYFSTHDTDMTDLLRDVFSDPAYFGADKIYMMEQVNKINDYDGHNTLGSAYLTASLPLGRVSILAGLRYEYNQMELVSNTRSYEESHTSHYYRHNDLFPSLNATWQLDSKSQLRLCYGRSVNRPEFREVSPSVYYDFDLASDVQGNFDLKNCYADNIDLRYEWYPSRGEVVSLAAFFKHFDSPIEWVYTMSGGTDVIYSYANAKSANSFGLELDVRKSLDFIGLPSLSWSFNGSLIHSRVHFEPGSNERSRAMQGQSPYLINTGLFYNCKPLQADFALLYNRIGKRIVGVGRTTGTEGSREVRVPDSYEMPRDAIDITAARRFGRHFEVKLAVRDLLNQDIVYKQFSKVTVGGKSKEVKQVTRRYTPGRNIGVTAVYKF